jgi:ribosomal protein L17
MHCMRGLSLIIKFQHQTKKHLIILSNRKKSFGLNQDLYSKGMISLTLQRNKEKQTADKIITSLKQNSISSEELGHVLESQ